MVITEQVAQSLTTSRVPVRTGDTFFRFDQRVPQPLMVALSMIMMDELGEGLAQLLSSFVFKTRRRPVPKLGPAGIDERTTHLEIRLKL